MVRMQHWELCKYWLLIFQQSSLMSDCPKVRAAPSSAWSESIHMGDRKQVLQVSVCSWCVYLKLHRSLKWFGFLFFLCKISSRASTQVKSVLTQCWLEKAFVVQLLSVWSLSHTLDFRLTLHGENYCVLPWSAIKNTVLENLDFFNPWLSVSKNLVWICFNCGFSYCWTQSMF